MLSILDLLRWDIILLMNLDGCVSSPWSCLIYIPYSFQTMIIWHETQSTHPNMHMNCSSLKFLLATCKLIPFLFLKNKEILPYCSLQQQRMDHMTIQEVVTLTGICWKGENNGFSLQIYAHFWIYADKYAQLLVNYLKRDGLKSYFFLKSAGLRSSHL